MSRSQPDERIPNPADRWLEWNGQHGNLRYFDKVAKTNVDVDLPFEFVLLDRLSCIKGWHDASEANIYSNEIRSTIDEPFIVKSFKMKDPIASGFYADIKDKIKASGGKFTVNCYIAYTVDDDKMHIGSLQFHGSAMRAWIEFSNDKDIRQEIYKKGITIKGAKSGKKGSISYKVPVLELVNLTKNIDEEATALDKIVQDYLRTYFKLARIEQAEPEEHPANLEATEATKAVDGDGEEIPF